MIDRGPEPELRTGRRPDAKNRILKRLLIAVGAVVVVVLVLFSIARAMFPADKLRQLAVTKLEAATGLDISVRDARISFVHWRLGVKVSDLEVSRPGEAAKLAIVPRMGAALSLLPLLRREIVVSQVYVDRPRLEIVTGRPLAPEARPGARGGSSAPALSLQLPRAVIKDAEVVIRDPKAGRVIKVENLDVTSTAKAGRSFETVTSDGKFSAGRVSVTSSATGKLVFPAQSVDGAWNVLARPKEQLLDLTSVTVNVAELPVEVTGKVNLAAPAADAGPGDPTPGTAQLVAARPGPELDLRIVMKSVPLEKLTSLAPEEVSARVKNIKQPGTLDVVSTVKGRLPYPRVEAQYGLTAGQATRLNGRAEVGGAEPRVLGFEAKGMLRLEEMQSLLGMGKGPKARSGDVALDVQGSAPLDSLKKNPYSLEARGRVSCDNVRIEDDRPGPQLLVEKLRVDLSGRQAEVSQTVVRLGKSTFNITGKVPDWRKRSFELKVNSPLLDLKELLEPAAPAQVKQPKKAASLPPLPFGALGMRGTTDVGVDRLTFGKFEAQDLAATVLMAGDSLSVTRMSMRTLGGEAGGKARLRVPKEGEPTYTATFTAAKVQLGALLDAFTPLKGLMSGTTSLDVEVNGILGQAPLLLKSITAGGDVKSSQVKAVAAPVVSALASWVGLENKKEYDIKDFTTAFSVRDGRLIVPACSLVEKNSTWKFSGSTGMDGSLDQKVNVILSPEYSKRVNSLKDLGQLLKDDQGRVVVDLFLGGTVKRPALRWDSATMEGRAKAYVTDKLKGELEKRVGGKLDVTPESRARLEQKADTLRKEAETVGKKLLEGLLKKKK